MISGTNRRDILERVRTGELSVTEAVTLMRADGHDGTEVVAYRAGWQRAEPAGAPPRHPEPAHWSCWTPPPPNSPVSSRRRARVSCVP